jgi:hypothetical protein
MPLAPTAAEGGGGLLSVTLWRELAAGVWASS